MPVSIGCDTRPVPRNVIARAAAPLRDPPGGHERHLAVSALAQQLSQGVAVLAMLVATTVLARHLTLAAFGTYGLLVSLTTYVIFVQASIEVAAVKAIAEADGQAARNRVFSTALALYLIAGVVSGSIVAGVGTLALPVFGIPSALQRQAQIAVVAVGAITAIGWPFKVFHDVLRGAQRFVVSAAAESVTILVVGATLIVLALEGGALWLLVAVGASVPLATGALCAILVRLMHLPYKYENSAVELDTARGFFPLSVNLLVSGVAELVIYALDRAVLAIFRSTAVVGLYEGPVRAHNLILQAQSGLATPTVSAAARFGAQGDAERTRALLLRGTRYMLAAVVPPTLVFVILAKPILVVWLGPRFAAAATAMSVLVSYWLLNAGVSVAGRMLVVAGRARAIAVYAVGVALTNLALSLALTPSLGLNGVVLGTTLAYVLGFPFFIRLTVRVFRVRLDELAREAWIPAYVTGLVVAAGLVAVRVTVTLDSAPRVLGAGLLAVLVYWAIYYAAWLRPSERVLVRSIAWLPFRARSGL
jgi:PST family polysaccharide transporter